ncbi:hypothetical protein SAMN05216481_103326 [Streptomyces radiopugnans]|uniref:Uncharacterized protein n=2 Tax=Streptomyces radiopugnans TaxID=403935 RepID=A0A1H9CMZ9_9ACTN|nr:hypothetical protein SAMN05216481_103326 [Streptomyces radiopugnans]
MAAQDLSAGVPAHKHPMASPGYGKRTAPGQRPRTAADFAHLPRREASVAAYLDRLPDGADISVKTLAKVLPDYGQCALGTVLRRLSEAGHLRRGREHITGGGSPRWVTRTYFSRTARGDAWWAAFLAGEQPGDEPAGHATEPTAESATGTAPAREPAPVPAPAPAPVRPPRSRAYGVLAGLGRAEPRMTLSAADCAALEELAGQWLERGADERQLTGALTAGLPPEVHHPAALARRRLTDKLPPEPAPESASASAPASGAPEPAVLRMAECTVCGVPGRPDALPGGLCRDCRGLPPAVPAGPSPAEIRARVDRLRAAARTSERSCT